MLSRWWEMLENWLIRASVKNGSTMLKLTQDSVVEAINIFLVGPVIQFFSMSSGWYNSWRKWIPFKRKIQDSSTKKESHRKTGHWLIDGFVVGRESVRKFFCSFFSPFFTSADWLIDQRTMKKTSSRTKGDPAKPGRGWRRQKRRSDVSKESNCFKRTCTWAALTIDQSATVEQKLMVENSISWISW